MKVLESYVPISITLFDEKPIITVVSVGVVTAVRDDGCYQITMPITHILINADGQSVLQWEDKKGLHVKGLTAKPYEISQPLMPPPEPDKTGRQKNGSTSRRG